MSCVCGAGVDAAPTLMASRCAILVVSKQKLHRRGSGKERVPSPRCGGGRVRPVPQQAVARAGRRYDCQSRLNRLTCRNLADVFNYNSLAAREGSTAVASPPPLALAKAFSRSGCGRIFWLFSRVMLEWLTTDPGTRRLGSGLSGSIFSGPHDCADLVNYF